MEESSVGDSGISSQPNKKKYFIKREMLQNSRDNLSLINTERERERERERSHGKMRKA
jgi:hypothetical protein